MPYYTYYVYILAYPDGRIFYVGKGQGDRIDQHEKEAARYRSSEAASYLPKKSAKIRVIQKIWAKGGSVVKAKVFETDNEQEANDYEKQFIAQCDPQYLTNRTKGGGPQFSKRDPYARIKHRELFYSPKEAHEKLGISQNIWNRLVQANVLHFYQVEGCTFPVLERKEIDDFAERIHDGTYPIDVWEISPRKQQTLPPEDPSSPPQAKTVPPLSRIEMLQEARAFALHTVQQANPSLVCKLIGSYERQGAAQQRAWEIHMWVGSERQMYSIGLQQGQFVILNKSNEESQ